MNETEPRLAAMRRFGLRLLALFAVVTALFAGLLLVVRPWYLHWGAASSERAGVLPGDELSPGPVNDTRAIDIAAPADRVFGLGRAFTRAVFEPLHFAMERRMLEGIRGLAEGDPDLAGSRHAPVVGVDRDLRAVHRVGCARADRNETQASPARLRGCGRRLPDRDLAQPAPIVSFSLLIVLCLLLWPLPRQRSDGADELLEQES